MNKNKFRAGVLIVLVVLSTVALIRYFSPFGFKAVYNISADSGLLTTNGLKSVKQLSGKSFNNIEIDQDEAKIDLEIPESPVPPKKITVDIKFRSNNEFQMGIYNNKIDEYEKTALFNPILQDINWRKVDDGGISIYQKNRNYKSVDELASDDKVIEMDGANVATYDYRLAPKITSPNDTSNYEEISSTLRGDHTVYVSVASNNLEISVEKKDLNQYTGKDELQIIGYSQNKIAFYDKIKDDSEEEKTGKSKDPQTVRISKNVKPGIYKIVFKGGNDIIINNLSFNQNLVVFDNLFLAGNPEIYPQVDKFENNKIFTNSSALHLALGHENQTQQIKIDSDAFDISDKETDINLNKSLSNILSQNDIRDNLSTVEISKNDIRVSGNGLFSFSKDSFFKPFFSSVKNVSANMDLANLDFIVARYSNPTEEGGWYHQKVEIPLNDDMIKNNKIEINISSQDNNKKKTWLKIKDLDITID